MHVCSQPVSPFDTQRNFTPTVRTAGRCTAGRFDQPSTSSLGGGQMQVAARLRFRPQGPGPLRAVLNPLTHKHHSSGLSVPNIREERKQQPSHLHFYRPTTRNSASAQVNAPSLTTASTVPSPRDSGSPCRLSVAYLARLKSLTNSRHMPKPPYSSPRRAQNGLSRSQPVLPSQLLCGPG